MWSPKEIQLAEKHFDSSDPGFPDGSGWLVTCDGMTLFNAVDHLRWDPPSIHTIICDCCLEPGCGFGDYVAVRGFGGQMLFMADFDAMLGGEWDGKQYAPPRWMLTRGPLLLDETQCRQIRSVAPHLPEIDSLPELTTQELVYLFRLQAPGSFLPDFLRPEGSRWDLILSTTGPDSERDLRYLKSIMSNPLPFTSHSFGRPAAGHYVVSVFLDDNVITEWQTLSTDEPPFFRLSNEHYFQLHE